MPEVTRGAWGRPGVRSPGPQKDAGGVLPGLDAPWESLTKPSGPETRADGKTEVDRGVVTSPGRPWVGQGVGWDWATLAPTQACSSGPHRPGLWQGGLWPIRCLEHKVTGGGCRTSQGVVLATHSSRIQVVP